MPNYEEQYYEAVKDEDVEAIKQVLSLGTDINMELDEDEQRTAISHLADYVEYREGHAFEAKKALECMKHLILQGADINKADEDGYTPLIFACRIGSTGIERVKLLVEHGADVNGECNYLGKSYVLHFAADSGSVPLVKYLVEQGANPRNKDHKGRKPVNLAGSKGVRDYLNPLSS